MLRNDAISGDYSSSYQAIGTQKSEVLLIWGTGDKEISQEMINEINSLIPHLEYKPVDGAGHGIVFQKPDIINELIGNFLL